MAVPALKLSGLVISALYNGSIIKLDYRNTGKALVNRKGELVK
jgi:hypothetical protein